MYSEICKYMCVALFVIDCIFAAPSKKSKLEFHPCKKSNPQFNTCLKDELHRVIPLLSDGYAKLRIPPIEPFDLPALDIAKGQGAVSIDLSLQKIKVHGLSSAIINSLQVDPEKLVGHAVLSFGKLVSLVGSYTAKGKVQILPINGKGPCNITMVDPILDLDIQAAKIVKNGVEYIATRKVVLKATSMKRLVLKLDNLFQGNKELSDNLNLFINENWELLFDELKPAFEEAIVTILRDIVDKIFAKTPLQDVFPA